MLRKPAIGLSWLLCGAWLLITPPAVAAGNDTLELGEDTASTAGAADPSGAEPATIDGFRSAQFGMTDTEVRAAIATDFALTGDQIEAGANVLEKTTSLGITVTDLVPDSGAARVVYIFGYESQALIQINVLWGIDGGSSAEQIRTAGSLLVSYFRSQNFDPEKAAVGVPLANGALLAFYAEDADGSSVTLTVASRGGDETNGETEPAEEALLMQLSYVADADDPDIYRLAPGSF